MKPAGTLLLTQRDVAALLDLDECTDAVEEAFRLHGKGETRPPGILGFPCVDGGFHIKAAALDLARPYFAVKTNGNFFRNPERFGMPAIQGVIALCDAENGYPLALLDSIQITILRTASATAVAAKYLARHDSAVATICGCGNQGRAQLAALTRVLPIRRVYAFDVDREKAQRFAEEVSAQLRIAIEVVSDLSQAVRSSDVCITCTPSRQAFLRSDDVLPGTFVAAVGADSPEKQELEPGLVASSKVVADILEQCATIGELHHAIEGGLLTKHRVHGELGEVVAGRKPGRESDREVIIFDSTGTALQDVAAAAVVYEKALRAGRGLRLDLAG